jgi:hypothetical protein
MPYGFHEGARQSCPALPVKVFQPELSTPNSPSPRATYTQNICHSKARFSEAVRRHYAKLYARPRAMHAGFAQFAAFD